MNNIPLSIFLSVGGTFVLICGVLLDLPPDSLTANSIIIQSLGMVGASFLVSVLIHLFITKQMAKNVELITVYAWYSNLVGVSIVINEMASL